MYTFHKEFDNFCGLLPIRTGLRGRLSADLDSDGKALSQFSPFQTLMSSVGKRELKQYVSEEAMENIMRQMIRLIDLLLDQALQEGVIEPQRPRVSALCLDRRHAGVLLPNCNPAVTDLRRSSRGLCLAGGCGKRWHERQLKMTKQ